MRLDEKRALEKLYAAEIEGALSDMPQIVRATFVHDSVPGFADKGYQVK